MSINRRDVLRGLVTGGAVCALAGGTASARERKVAPDDAVGMLYDATRCIGCKACVVACKDANELSPETTGHGEGLYDAPDLLTSSTKNIIQLHKDGDELSYMKKQCMHCIDPGCVSVCMIGALEKREGGIVSYDVDRCVGCRYCQIACPFNVPKFEWESASPKIVKCELCRHLIKEGGIPGCCDVCPRAAVIYGSYDELLADAKKRLADSPDRYEPKIYGETDAGGTQVLYLSAAGVTFGELGLPSLGDEPVPQLSETVQHGIYQFAIVPAALYAALGVAVWRSKRSADKDAEQNEEGQP